MVVDGNRAGNRRATAVAAPLRKQVIGLLRDAILEFDYQPGDRLVERDLCERFAVSRTVVREALRHLEAEGLVEIVPNRGPIVFSITYEDAKSLYEVREALESLGAKLCAERATPNQREKLSRSFKKMETAFKGHKLADELAAKDDFYGVLFAIATNEIVESMLRMIRARIHMLRGLSLQVPGRADRSIEELRRLVRAIEDGDGELAGAIGAEHVRNAASAALASFADSKNAESMAQAT